MSLMRRVILAMRGAPPEEWVQQNSLPVGGVPVPRRLLEGNIALLGSAGSGKTTLLIALLASLLRYKPSHITFRNAFIYEPKNEFVPIIRSMGLPNPIINANPLHKEGA